MTPRTKHMVAGGAIGALALTLGYGLFRSRKEILRLAEPRREHEKHEKRGKHEKHEKRGKHRHDENDRGEYGRKHERKHHHHEEHERGD